MGRVVARGGRNWGVALGPIGAMFLLAAFFLYVTVVVVIALVMMAAWATWQGAVAIERRRTRRRQAPTAETRTA